jgi:hypothetical protein
MKTKLFNAIMTAAILSANASAPANPAAEGCFRLDKIGARHVLLDPEGLPFFTLGINHINAVQEAAEPDIFAEAYEGDWSRYSEAAAKDLKGWHYNTAGYGSPQEIYPHLPYMEDSFLERNSNFLPDAEFFYPDVFDSKVQAEKLKKLRWMCRNTDNPNLIGYYWTDTPQWDLERSLKTRGTNWVITIRELPADAPGRIRYEQYLDTCKSGGEPATDEGFLALIAQAHYKLIGEATRELHPGALIFGERYLSNDHPEVVVEAALPYIDVLSIQPGSDRFEVEYFDALYEKYGKPILICDHQCSFATPQYEKTMWKQLESEQAVADMYRNYLAEASSRPYILGYHRCQYIDRFNEHPGVLKQGMLREDGTAYPVLQDAVKEANQATLDYFSSQTQHSH